MKAFPTHAVLAVLAVFLAPIFASAEEGAKSPDAKRMESFQRHKQERVEEMDIRISAMQAMKACLSGAADPEAVKKCHEEERKTMKEMRAKRSERRKQHIDERIKKLQDEKAKMDQKSADGK